MASPSNRRSEGRNAFSPGGDPELLCPYTTGQPWFKENWMDGWGEAEADYRQEEKVSCLEGEKWEEMKWGCPWFRSDVCSAGTELNCSKENCAPYYFVKNA